MKERFSDEHLNAYLDGELDNAERLHLMDALRSDPALASRVCQLQKVKEMVQLAYPLHAETGTNPNSRRRERRWLSPALAASVLFLLGLAGGWFANLQYHSTPSLLEIAKTSRLDTRHAGKPWRLMLHVNSADTHRYQVMLSETEELLRTARAEGRPIQVEIVTNGPGLKLLSDHDDPVTRKLQTLAHQYDNLELRACERALRRYRAREGKDLRLIPEAGTVRSAMHEVIKRQQEGWAYINI